MFPILPVLGSGKYVTLLSTHISPISPAAGHEKEITFLGWVELSCKNLTSSRMSMFMLTIFPTKCLAVLLVVNLTNTQLLIYLFSPCKNCYNPCFPNYSNSTICKNLPSSLVGLTLFLLLFQSMTFLFFLCNSEPYFLDNKKISWLIIIKINKNFWEEQLVLTSTIILGCKSRMTHDHILLRHDSGSCAAGKN
jgi:hypothetical protein